MPIENEEANVVIDGANVVEIDGTDTCLEVKVGEKIIVLIDAYKTGYECKVCKGACKVPSAVVQSALVTCKACNGKGVIEGGLVIPEVAKSLPSTGVVMSCGPDVPPERCKNGDRVLMGPHAGTFLPIKTSLGGANFKVLKYTEILAHVYKNENDSNFDPDIINYEHPDYK